jgi:hypothetical protein
MTYESIFGVRCSDIARGCCQTSYRTVGTALQIRALCLSCMQLHNRLLHDRSVAVAGVAVPTAGHHVGSGAHRPQLLLCDPPDAADGMS